MIFFFRAGYLQTAYGCLLQASAFDMPEFFVEKAKWLWEKVSGLMIRETKDVIYNNWILLQI